jgi:predicted glycoside hydrolase/deacetylase ChbG (UPF0249 family)
MNPSLCELGFSPGDRVVVVHADDIGMCHSTLPALEELFAVGLVTSASAMVPCPLFREVVTWRQRNPDVDLGVHLTLTSEWQGYRWGPVGARSDVGSLIDDRGYLYRDTKLVRQNATPDSVRSELKAQVERAERCGLAPTHLDNHMYVALCEEFMEDYLTLGWERAIPAFLPRKHEFFALETINEWEMRGMPVFDCVQVATKPTVGTQRDDQLRSVFDALPTGLSCILLHPVLDTPEIRHITPDWRCRVADFDAFRSRSLLRYVRELGIQLISYAPLLKAMRLRIRNGTV